MGRRGGGKWFLELKCGDRFSRGCAFVRVTLWGAYRGPEEGGVLELRFEISDIPRMRVLPSDIIFIAFHASSRESFVSGADVMAGSC